MSAVAEASAEPARRLPGSHGGHVANIFLRAAICKEGPYSGLYLSEAPIYHPDRSNALTGFESGSNLTQTVDDRAQNLPRNFHSYRPPWRA